MLCFQLILTFSGLSLVFLCQAVHTVLHSSHVLKVCNCLQVVNVDDLTNILGARPYTTAESRNIDKYRDGFDKPAVPVDTEPEQTPGDNSEGGQGANAAPGSVVDGPDAPGQAPPTPTEVPGEMPGVHPGPIAPSGKTVAS